MKKTKLMSVFIALCVSFSLVMAGCKNDEDDDKTPSLVSEISDEQLELESAAFNVFRGLLSLTTDDDATNSEAEKGNGIELLPSNWKTATFENLDQSLIAVEGEEGVYKLGCDSLDEAKEFVSSLTDEEFDSDTYSWTLPGFGSLYFASVSGDASCLATLDVNIPQIPSLAQIKFVPSGTLSEASNKYSGASYYSAGDIIERKKDHSIWMCVRPSSGTYKKDYSYWICLNPGTEGIIKTEQKTAKDSDGQTVTWTFAKNLVSLKIAKAAIHTLNSLAYSWLDDESGGYEHANSVYTNLKSKGYDVRNLAADTTENNFTPQSGNSLVNSFFIAYGSPKNDGKRTTTGKNANAQNKLVQPILACRVKKTNSDGKKMSELMYTHITTLNNKTETLLSLTDSHDPKYVDSIKNKDSDKYYNIAEFSKVQTHGADYDVGLYFQKTGGLGYNRSGAYLPTSLDGNGGFNVLITPELKIKDHGTEAKGYTEVYRQRTGSGNQINSEEAFDYWASLTIKSTLRNINGKNVSIDKEANE